MFKIQRKFKMSAMLVFLLFRFVVTSYNSKKTFVFSNLNLKQVLFPDKKNINKAVSKALQTCKNNYK